jgi:SAM-dependent methyltransferase
MPEVKDQVRFSDGASYDAMMGPWSRSAGEIFLDWINPGSGLSWIDVGCGSGAFTALVVERCAPSAILGVDPSEGQLNFARARTLGPIARFELGDAMALPLADASVDVAAAALVVHFMPDPAKGIAEMARVTRPGGIVATYAWDLIGGGFPYDAVFSAMRSVGSPPPAPPSPEAAGATELHHLFTAAGLTAIEAREIRVTRTFRDFDDYWSIATTAPRTAIVLNALAADTLADLKARVRAALPTAQNGTVVPTARANAIWGRVP